MGAAAAVRPVLLRSTPVCIHSSSYQGVHTAYIAGHRSNKCFITSSSHPPLDAPKCSSSSSSSSSSSKIRRKRGAKHRDVEEGYAEESSSDTCREANLVAQRSEKITLPYHATQLGTDYSIQEFLNHPSGVESILNLKALQSYQPLDSHTYRCTLQTIQFMTFEVIPIIDLRVTYTSNGCNVEMLSCKFEGSEILKKQSHRFSASLKNYITWEVDASKTSLYFDVCLTVTLQVFTKPFTFLPIAAVEKPGNLMVRGLVDRLVPFLVSQLLKDYERWLADRSTVNEEQ